MPADLTSFVDVDISLILGRLEKCNGTRTGKTAAYHDKTLKCRARSSFGRNNTLKFFVSQVPE